LVTGLKMDKESRKNNLITYHFLGEIV